MVSTYSYIYMYVGVPQPMSTFDLHECRQDYAHYLCQEDPFCFIGMLSYSNFIYIFDFLGGKTQLLFSLLLFLLLFE